MAVDLASALIAEEIKFQKRENAEAIAEHFRLEYDVAERIAAMAKSLDQAVAIAELMR